MKLPVFLLAAGLAACSPEPQGVAEDAAVSPDAGPDEAVAPAPDEPQDYVCPTEATLNCMPIVPPERAQICSAPSRDWIMAHCPDVTVTF